MNGTVPVPPALVKGWERQWDRREGPGADIADEGVGGVKMPI